MSHINKRGDFFILFLSILIIVAYVFAGMSYFALEKKKTGTKVVGEIQSKIINASMGAEKNMFFIEKSVEYAAYEAIKKMGDSGGVRKDKVEDCNKNYYSLWNKDCFDIKKMDQSFRDYFRDTIGNYHINDFSYGIKEEQDLVIYGEAKEVKVDEFYSYDPSFNLSIDYNFEDYRTIYNAVKSEMDKCTDINLNCCLKNVMTNDPSKCFDLKDYNELEDYNLKAYYHENRKYLSFDVETEKKVLNKNGEMERVMIKFIIDLDNF